MKTRALLLALPVLALAGCTRQNHASVAIQAICYPTDTCTFSSTCTNSVIGTPIVDVSANGGTTEFFLQVANQLPDNSDKDAGRVNTNGAHVDQVSVSYDQVGLPTDSYYTSNMVIPADGTNVIAVWATRAWVGNNATILQDAVAAGGGVAELVAKIRLRGYYDDGSTFETGEFKMGVNVCDGCLNLPFCPPGKSACPFEGMEPVGCGTTGG